MDSTNEIEEAAGAQRRGFPKCMLWAGAGVLWTVSGGSALLSGSAMAATSASGELTFVATTVVDLAADGFPLVGGRIDMVSTTPVPTLVYQRREHQLALSEMPAPARDAPASLAAQRAMAILCSVGPTGGASMWPCPICRQPSLKTSAPRFAARPPPSAKKRQSLKVGTGAAPSVHRRDAKTSTYSAGGGRARMRFFAD
jgi:hypothetical protein